MTSRTLRLRIELVPEPLWGRNLRALLSPGAWQKLRKKLIAERGLTCAICGAVEESAKRIHAHEEWSYDTTQTPAVARVSRVELVCARCHAVEHFGRLRRLYKDGRLEERVLEDVIAHFCAVNEVDVDAFLAHEDEAVREWRRLNRVADWIVDPG